MNIFFLPSDVYVNQIAVFIRKTVIVTFAISLLGLPVHASNYGTTGVIEIPSARMQSDGTFSFGITHDGLLESYAMTYQAFDWLEGTFRYTGTSDIYPGSDYVYWDRNYEVKARLLSETDTLPELSVGIRDLVGTGKYGAEYLVANKQFNNWDVTFGLGWGRLADRANISNPLTVLSDNFKTRIQDTGLGGEVSAKTFFRGKNMGFFGGATYRFDDLPLSAHVEYNPDENRWEGSRGRDPLSTSPLSYGLTWHAADTIDISLSHQHLEHIGVRIQVRMDTAKTPTHFKPKGFVSALDMTADDLPNGLNPALWYDRFLYDIERADLFVLNAKLFPTESRAEIEINNDTFAYWPDALAKAHEITSLHVPSYITTIDYIINEQGHQLHTVTLSRLQPGALFSWGEKHLVRPGRAIIAPNHTTGFVKDDIYVDATIDTRFMLFDPDQPLTYQLFARLGTKIDLPHNWVMRAGYRFDIYNNIDDLSRVSDSVLPHVRSDSLKYLQQGQNGIESLLMEKRGTFVTQPTLHYRIYGGVLEDMFSGIGGEMLYQPYASRLAFGVSAAYAVQREYDGGLGHLDYKVLTGHASVFWATPFEGYDMAVHAGRYLAKDLGATVEVRRTFDNGWQLGLWATITDVPFDEFGEGSFDKGMFFRIPFDSLFGNGRKSVSKTRIRPIQRDGGARLEGYSGELWWEMRDARFDMFANPIRR